MKFKQDQYTELTIGQKNILLNETTDKNIHKKLSENFNNVWTIEQVLNSNEYYIDFAEGKNLFITESLKNKILTENRFLNTQQNAVVNSIKNYITSVNTINGALIVNAIPYDENIEFDIVAKVKDDYKICPDDVGRLSYMIDVKLDENHLTHIIAPREIAYGQIPREPDKNLVILFDLVVTIPRDIDPNSVEFNSTYALGENVDTNINGYADKVTDNQQAALYLIRNTLASLNTLFPPKCSYMTRTKKNKYMFFIDAPIYNYTNHTNIDSNPSTIDNLLNDIESAIANTGLDYELKKFVNYHGDNVTICRLTITIPKDVDYDNFGKTYAFGEELVEGKSDYDYKTAPVKDDDIFDQSTLGGFDAYAICIPGNKYYQYAIDNKNKKGEIVMMSPNEYYKECATKIFNNTTVDRLKQSRRAELGDLADVITVDHKKFPMCFISYADKSQEGLHRMMVAGDLFGGDHKFPVLVIHTANSNESYKPIHEDIADGDTFENGVYTVRANENGVAHLVNSEGHIVKGKPETFAGGGDDEPEQHITTIKFEGNIKTLPYGFLDGEEYLEELIIPEGIETIESGALYNLINLKYLYIPNSCKHLEEEFMGRVYYDCKISIPDTCDPTDVVYLTSGYSNIELRDNGGSNINRIIAVDDKSYLLRIFSECRDMNADDLYTALCDGQELTQDGWGEHDDIETILENYTLEDFVLDDLGVSSQDELVNIVEKLGNDNSEEANDIFGYLEREMGSAEINAYMISAGDALQDDIRYALIDAIPGVFEGSDISDGFFNVKISNRDLLTNIIDLSHEGVDFTYYASPDDHANIIAEIGLYNFYYQESYHGYNDLDEYIFSEYLYDNLEDSFINKFKAYKNKISSSEED